MKPHASTLERPSYDDFLYSLQDPEIPAPALSPRLFSQALQLDLQSLADQAHVHRNTLRRAPTTPSVQRYIRESVKVIKAAFSLSGDMAKALIWYRNDGLECFGYKTAEELVSDGRTEDVLRYMASLQAGAAG